MEVNPYQSPIAQSSAPVEHGVLVTFRPRARSGPTLLQFTIEFCLLATAIVSCIVFAAIAGTGAFLAGLAAWLSVLLCSAFRRRRDRFLYGVIVCSTSVSLALCVAFMIPAPLALICLVIAIGLGLLRIWFRSLDERNLVGLSLLKQENYELAISEFNKILRRDPRQYNALVNRAVAEASLGHVEQSKTDLDEAIRLWPDLQSAYARRGEVHSLREDWYEAVADLQVALKKSPDDSHSRYRLAVAHFHQMDYDKAKADLDPLFQINSFRVEAYVLRGGILIQQHDHAAAIADFEAVVAIDQKRIEAWHAIGIYSASSPYPNARNGQRGITAATRACELTSYKEWNVVSVLAAAYADAGQFDLAIQWAKEALRLAPPEERATRELRITQYEAGQPYRMP